jgi:hypothetical protein
MKKIILFLMLVVLLVPISASSASLESLLGLQIGANVGMGYNNLLWLYENKQAIEEIKLGRNIFYGFYGRFFVWKFYLGGDFNVTLHATSSDQAYTSGGFSLGMFPLEFLNLEFGLRNKELEMLAIPYRYHEERLIHNEHKELYFKILIDVGKTWGRRLP